MGEKRIVVEHNLSSIDWICIWTTLLACHAVGYL